MITGLDITMQPLIQPFLSQIIDSCFYFPERFSDFSCWKYPKELQLLHLKISYHFHESFLVFFYNKVEFSIEIKDVAKPVFHKKKTLCSSIKRKRGIFREKNRGFVDSEFVKICHEQVNYLWFHGNSLNMLPQFI